MASHRLLPAGSYAEITRTFYEGSVPATLTDANHTLTVTPELGTQFTVNTTRDGATLTAPLSDTQLAQVGRLELTWQAERAVVDDSHDRVAQGVLRRKETLEIVGGLYADIAEVDRFLKGDFRQHADDSVLESALVTAVDWIDNYTRTVWSPRWTSETVAWPYELCQWDVRDVLVVRDATTDTVVPNVTWDAASRTLMGDLPERVVVGYSYGPEITPQDISYCAARLGSHIVRLVYSAQATQARSIQSETGLIQLNTGGTYMRPTGMGEVDAILGQRRKQTWVY